MILHGGFILEEFAETGVEVVERVVVWFRGGIVIAEPS